MCYKTLKMSSFHFPSTWGTESPRFNGRGTLKASTLIEVLTAMIIVLICFSIGMSAMLQLNHSHNLVVEMRAKSVLNDYVASTLNKKEYIDEEINTEDFSLKRSAQIMGNRKNIALIHFEVYSLTLKKKLAEQNKIVVTDDE